MVVSNVESTCWAAQDNSWLLTKLTQKGVVFSVLFSVNMVRPANAQLATSKSHLVVRTGGSSKGTSGVGTTPPQGSQLQRGQAAQEVRDRQ